MKIKNILLAVVVLAVSAVPLVAQDYHEIENREEISLALQETHLQSLAERAYLNVSGLISKMIEDLPIDLEKLKEKTANSIADNKISVREQYDIIVLSVKLGYNEVLEAVLEAGFNPKADEEINAVSKIKVLPFSTYTVNNEKAKELLNRAINNMNSSKK